MYNLPVAESTRRRASNSEGCGFKSRRGAQPQDLMGRRSTGRTADSGSANEGSSPSAPATPARSSKVEHPAHNRAVGSSNLPAQTFDVTRRAIITVDPDLLIEGLRLPAGTQIIGASCDLRRGGVVELVVSHPSLPETGPGLQPVEARLYVASQFRW